MSSACKKDEVVWDTFIGDDDRMVIEVTDTVGEFDTIDLHSTTGATVIGDVLLDPSAGPVGTEHRIDLTVLNEYEDRVARVDVEVTSVDRGSIIFELEQDSADLGRWVLSITSNGEEGEERTDELHFRLFELIEVIEAETNNGGLFGF